MPDLQFETLARRTGHCRIAGIDEAGRGPLAGPVVAAAVILPEDFVCPDLDDSKKLTARKREHLYSLLTADERIDWAVASADCSEIERLNILKATHLAMRRAAESLENSPDWCLIDGLPVANFTFPNQAIVKGDGRSLSIAAASILAKVTRDRLMKEIDEEFPQYGFARNQGYGTKEHLEALRTHGPCRHHRRTFQPVAQFSLPLD